MVTEDLVIKSQLSVPNTSVTAKAQSSNVSITIDDHASRQNFKLKQNQQQNEPHVMHHIHIHQMNDPLHKTQNPLKHSSEDKKAKVIWENVLILVLIILFAIVFYLEFDYFKIQLLVFFITLSAALIIIYAINYYSSKE